MRAWECGLKTGLYYLRTKALSFPLPYGISLRSVTPDTDVGDEDDDDMPPPLEDVESPLYDACCGA